MKKVKYVRISTTDQNTARQEMNSSNFDIVLVDKCSGAIKLVERKEGKKLIKMINEGQISEVHVASIDRLGRNLIDVLSTIEYFNNNSINLFVENIGMYSMVDGRSNSTFNMIISVLANVSVLEREFILDRQRQGILAAKVKGTYKGRLLGAKMSDAQLLEKYRVVVKELKSGQSLRRAARLGECSLGTAQRVQKILMSTEA
jgi:DNA invertase Pin-like site-specific DNA recombinase